MATAIVPTPHPSFASGSLYVGDLHPEISENQLFEVFKKVGPVASIRVCRDAITRRSLGYAYVNFHNYSDAERALDLLNYNPLSGRPLRIMWSQRDPALRKSGSGNIFIKNLDKTVDNKALYDTFSTFGNILSCKVAMDENGVSRGFGFVHYDSHKAAQEAINKVNGMELCGKICYVGEFVSQKDRLATQEPKWTNIFVKNISKEISKDKLTELFKPFGTITSLYLAVDETGKSKGFGFVNYETHEQASKAVNEMNHKEIDSMPLYVGRAQKKVDREKELRSMFERFKKERISKYQGVNLYVKNLDDTVTDEILRQEFSSAGTITSAKVMTDEKGQSKGFGFVCFSTPEEATKAVTEMNSKMIANKPIYVAVAQRKEQRRAQLEAQYAHRNAALRNIQPGMNLFPPPMFFPSRGGFMVPPMVRGGRYPPAGRGFPGPFPMAPRGRGGMQRGKIGRGEQSMPASGYGIKYNPNVRNPTQPNAPEQTPPLDKQMLGETIYVQVGELLKSLNLDENLAGKITGMFLESMTPENLFELTRNQPELQKNFNEAILTLKTHGLIVKE